MSLHERGGIGVIEADETVGESLVQRLELEGYSPLWWQTGRAALDQLPKAGPDLVICDTLLPDMSGKDVLLGALPELGGKPFLFVTAHAQVEEMICLFKAGAVDYIVKPYDVPDLLSRIDRLIRAERQYIRAMLADVENRIDEAAKRLGISRRRPQGQGSAPAPAPTPSQPVRPKPRSGGAAAPVEVTEESPPDAMARLTVSLGKTRDFGGQRRLGLFFIWHLEDRPRYDFAERRDQMCHEVYRSYITSADWVDMIKKNLGRGPFLFPYHDQAIIAAKRLREAEAACPCSSVKPSPELIAALRVDPTLSEPRHEALRAAWGSQVGGRT